VFTVHVFAYKTANIVFVFLQIKLVYLNNNDKAFGLIGYFKLHNLKGRLYCLSMR